MRKFLIVAGLLASCGKGDGSEESGGTNTGTATASGGSETTTSGVTETGVTGTGTMTAPTTGEPDPTTGSTDPTSAGEPGSLTRVLAVDSLFFGDAEEDGWRQYGRDVDGLASSGRSTDLCSPASGGASMAVYPDGDAGIDNAFGKSLVPLFVALNPAFGGLQNARISEGTATILLAPKDPEQAPAASFAAWLLMGAELGGAPKFDGSDMWPIDPSSLTDAGDATSAKCQLSATTIAGDTLVTAPDCQFTLDLDFGVASVMHLPVRALQLRMALAADQSGASAGQLSGVIPTEALVAEMARFAGSLDVSLCEGATLESIQTQIRQASDILVDGTQAVNKTCDGISLGIGFTMRAVELGAVAEAATPVPDPCP